MAEQIGIIIGIEPDGRARVLTDRKGACGGCDSSHGGCHSCLAGAKFESRVDNPLGAQQGDIVKISLCSKDFFEGAALLYLMPVVALLIGALAGAWIGDRFGWPQSTAGVLGAVAGIGLAVLFLIWADRSQAAGHGLRPRIVEVLGSASTSSQSAAVKPACCG
jgi:sigma-E factor negative regulatory protein RseC